jgi:putative ABC transport system substrate-binding protein
LRGGILTAKRLELLHELVPNAGTLAVLVNPNNVDTRGQLHAAQEAARTIRRELLILNAQNESEIDAAFKTLSQRSVAALVIAGDPFFASRRNVLNRLIKEHGIAAASFNREIAASDIAIAYGARLTDSYRQAGVYVGRILKGAKPIELPGQRANRFELIINLKTIKALGLIVPPSLLLRADEVIE